MFYDIFRKEEIIILVSKREKKELKKVASRQFTDREEPRKTFENALNDLQKDFFKVLVFYGVGGIGKSRLQKELINMAHHRNESITQITINFHEASHRDEMEALVWFRQQLINKTGMSFKKFDFAYAIYWKIMNPNVDMKTTKKNLPFLEEGNFITEVITQFDNLPVVQWIPKSVKFIEGIVNQRDLIQNWWNKEGQFQLITLKNMPLDELKNSLKDYWADDVTEWLSLHDEKIIFYYDTYEALWEKERSVGNFEERDDWIRELIIQLQELPILHVITGREKVTWGKIDTEWDEVLDQHLIGELAKNDSKSFLSACGIEDKKIQQIIIEASSGLPYYLDLMVDTYQLISKTKIPTSDDFSKRPNEVLNRFLKYLDNQEKDCLQLLSVAKNWNEDVFNKISRHFQIYSPSAFKEISRFSFIQRIEQSNDWSMHKLMQDALYENLSPSIRKQVHQILFDYYTDLLKNAPQTLTNSFTEALHHAKYLLNEKQWINWLSQHIDPLLNAGKWSFMTAELTLLTESLAEKVQVHTLLMQKIGEIYSHMGKYNDAVNWNKKVYLLLETKKNQPTDELYKKLGLIQQNLGEIYQQLNNYEETILAYETALDYFDLLSSHTPSKLQYMSGILVRLGKTHILLAQFKQASKCYFSAIEYCQNAITKGKTDVYTHAILGEAYEKIGEILNEIPDTKENSIAYFKNSISAYDKALVDVSIPKYLQIKTRYGLAHKRLAEGYSKTTNYSEKTTYFYKALEIYNEIIEKAPDYVDCYEKRGHAAVDLLELLIEFDDTSKQQEVFQLAVESFQKAIELSDQQGSSRNRLGSAYRTLGKKYMRDNNFGRAEIVFKQALQINDDVFKYSPDYIYAYNSRGKIFIELGKCYIKLNNSIEAKNSLLEAKSCFEKMLKKTPNLQAAIRHIESIDNLLQEI